MANVVLERLSKTYAGGRVAVHDISLEVQDQEFVVLVGPSGCGKTTTLRMIAGLEDISSGEIKINGRVVNHIPPKDRDIAMVFQNYALYPHMTVYKNMAFGLELRQGVSWAGGIWRRLAHFAGVSHRPAGALPWRKQREAIRNQVHEAAAMLGIEPLLQRFPRELSGGERQRVALGRAIVRQPQAFLFDEPLSNLDARLRGEMRRELQRLHQQLKTTVVYVTHDQIEALTLGDRIVVMHEGRVQQVGRPMEVYDKPANLFVAGFLGSPPMNLVSGVIEEGGVIEESGVEGRDEAYCFFGGGICAAVAGGQSAQHRENSRQNAPREVVLGVRPEDIAIRPVGEAAVNDGAASSGVKPVTAKVLSVENLGDAVLVQVLPQRTEEQRAKGDRAKEQRGDEKVEPFVCRTSERTNWAVGDEVQLEIHETNMHWFDRKTEQRITLGGCE